jgi:hypothetical protein
MEEEHDVGQARRRWRENSSLMDKSKQLAENMLECCGQNQEAVSRQSHRVDFLKSNGKPLTDLLIEPGAGP